MYSMADLYAPSEVILFVTLFVTQKKTWNSAMWGAPLLVHQQRTPEFPLGISPVSRGRPGPNDVTAGAKRRSEGKRSGKSLDMSSGTSSILDRALFSAAELLGMALSSREDAAPTVVADGPAECATSTSTLAATVVPDDAVSQRIANLFASSYFFCGTGDEEDWDVFAPDCLFSDEFSSFVGTDRFRRNVRNFGRALQSTPERVCRLTKLERGVDELGRQTISASWIFRSRVIWLGGMLAASGTTTYVVGGSGKIVEHNERWATSKADVFRRLLFGG